MFAPNKKGLSPFPMPMDRKRKFLTSPNPRSPRVLAVEKGMSKVVALAESSSADVAEAEVWKRFREAGLLDESELRRKDREVLVERIQELEKELHDYQYHMGLLLIEKEKWAVEYKEIRQVLAEAEGISRREQMGHLVAISESEKREENIQKALMVEKQCVKDLEQALLKMSAEIADAKLTSHKELVKAHLLKVSDEQNYLETKGKLYLTDAKMSKENQSTKVDMKPDELEARECRLQNECTSCITEMHDKDLACQRDDMRACEQRLLEHPYWFGEGQLYLGWRENRAVESTSIAKKKRVEEEEDDISIRLQSLIAKEKDVDDKLMNLEKKERDLLIREEKLAARESVEIQKLIGDHNLSRDYKKPEFELELDKRRKPIGEDLKEKLGSLEKKTEINYLDDQNLIRENTLEGKIKKLKDKEKEIDTKLKLFKEREDYVHREIQELKDGKERLEIDVQKLVTSKAELESSKTVFYTEKQQIIKEKENLKLMKLEVKQEIEKWRILNESLMKEADKLSQEKNELDRELEVLDERRTALETELKQLICDREALNDWRCVEEEKLRNESLKMRVDKQEEAEELRLKKEALEKECSNFSRKVKSRMRVLEEMERKLREKEKEIEGEKITKQNVIKLPNSFEESNFPKLRKEQDWSETEEQEISTKRRKLETGQFEMHNIDMIQRNLLGEQEAFIKEKDHFLAAAEQCVICKNCGVAVRELDSIQLQTPSRTAIERNILQEKNVDGSESVRMSCHLPSLQKCSTLYSFSPRAIVGHPIEGNSSKPTSSDREASDAKTGYGPERANYETGVGDSRVSDRLCKDGEEPEAPLGIADTSIQKWKTKLTIDVQDRGVEAESQTLSAKHRGHQNSRRGRPKTIKRINSAKSVVQDAKAIPREISQERHQTSGRAEDLVYIDEGSRRDLVPDDQMTISADQKQDFHRASGVTIGQLDSEDGGTFSENQSVEVGHKRQQTSAPGTAASGEKRYNFRLSTINRRTWSCDSD